MSSHPCQNMEEYTVEAGSPEATALREILGRYANHPFRGSLTGETGIQDMGNVDREKSGIRKGCRFCRLMIPCPPGGPSASAGTPGPRPAGRSCGR